MGDAEEPTTNQIAGVLLWFTLTTISGLGMGLGLLAMIVFGANLGAAVAIVVATDLFLVPPVYIILCFSGGIIVGILQALRDHRPKTRPVRS